MRGRILLPARIAPLALLVAGCAALPGGGPRDVGTLAAPEPIAVTGLGGVDGGQGPGQRAEPGTRPMPRPDPAAAPAPRAPAPAPAGGLLGRATGSLGDAGEPGFWVMTPLVPAPREGRVRLPGGPAVAVELRPYGGGGTLLSAAAMQALGVALTALPEIEILAP